MGKSGLHFWRDETKILENFWNVKNEQLKILGSSELKSHYRFLCTDQHAESNTEPPVGNYIISKTRIRVIFRKKNQIDHNLWFIKFIT